MAADSGVCESWSILCGGDSGGVDNGIQFEVERGRFMDWIGSRSRGPVLLLLSCHMPHRLGEEGCLSFIFEFNHCNYLVYLLTLQKGIVLKATEARLRIFEGKNPAQIELP